MQLIERDGHVRAEEGTVEVDTAVIIGAGVFVDVAAATVRRRKMDLLKTGRSVSNMLEAVHLLSVRPYSSKAIWLHDEEGYEKLCVIWGTLRRVSFQLQ